MAKKILIVEDDHNISELLQLYLNNEGYQTVIANDGGEGIDQFRKFQPDLVLLDIMLPVMDGWGVLRTIRQDSKTPVIMLTAKGETTDKVSGLKQGAEGPDAEESGDAFFAYRHQDVAGAFLFQTGHQASASGNDDIFHAPGRKAAAQFHNDLFHASGFHGGDEMYYFHKARS